VALQIEAPLLRLELAIMNEPMEQGPLSPSKPMGMTARNKYREVEPATERKSLPHAITGL
jgi:hypothetical protein